MSGAGNDVLGEIEVSFWVVGGRLISAVNGLSMVQKR